MKIALCQFHIEWENKEINLKRAEEFIRIASESACDMILFPEMSFTGFSAHIEITKEKNNKTNNRLRKIALQYQIAIGYGWVRENMSQPCKAENHYSIVTEEGEILSDYVKIHSFRYGGEGEQFVSGNKLCLFDYKGFSFAQFICYDLRFPEIFQAASSKATILLVPADWPEKRSEHWKTLLQARAIENQAYVLGINCVGKIGELQYSGDSCVINPDGKIENKLSQAEGIIYAEISENALLIRESFPVKQDRKESLYKALYIM